MMKRALCLAALLTAFPAILLAQKAKPVPPGSPDEWLRLAEEKRAAGDVDGALELLRKAAAVPAAAGEASLRMGRLLEAKNDLDTALDAYRQAGGALSGPGRGEALARLALVQEVRGLSEAKASAQAAAEADPAGPWPAIALARARAREGKGDEALALAQKARTGGGAAAAAAEGRAQEARGDLAAAEAAERQALQAEPANLLAQIDLARVLRKLKRPAEALPLLQKVLEGAPGAVAAYMESARAKIALGRAEDASADAQTAAAMAEGDKDAQALLEEVTVAGALAHLKGNQLDLATQDLDGLLAKDPSFAPAHVGMARVLIARRQLDPAAAALETALALDPRLAEAHFQKGYLNQVFRQNSQAALGSYETAVSLSPEDTGYRTQLGAALLDLKQYDRAIEALSRVTATAGYDRPEAFIYLGAAELGAKRYKDGIPPLEKAVALQPSSSQAEAYLAWCYFGLKDSTNFKLHGGRARTLGHTEPTLLQYLGRIEKGEAIK
jgi:tetratricopeptide (TPR) repeat protein